MVCRARVWENRVGAESRNYRAVSVKIESKEDSNYCMYALEIVNQITIFFKFLFKSRLVNIHCNILKLLEINNSLNSSATHLIGRFICFICFWFLGI